MAIGKSGENMHVNKIQIKFGDYLVTQNKVKYQRIITKKILKNI